MRYTRRIAILFLTLTFILGLYVASASAERRGVYVRRPVIVRQYWDNPWQRAWYDPFYDPYFYDPYLREQRERYYKEKDVKDSAKKLNKDRQKYAEDGVITAKEQEKLDKRARDHSKALEKLNKFNREGD